jgi:hypothetical protein
MHLDTDLRNDMIGLREDMKAQFEQVNKRFERVYSFMKWQAGFAMTFLIAIFGALGSIYIQLLHLQP